jgi:hypothetical protein
MDSSGSLDAQAEWALQEEQAQPEHTDDGHDGSPVAEALGRGDDAMAVARRLASSRDPLAQAAAAHILAYRVNGGCPDYAPEAVGVLRSMLIRADLLHLQYSIADALRLTWHVSAVEPLLTLVDHSSTNVRQTVATGLGGAMARTPVAAGIDALVRLSRDPEGTVRDWATFELACRDDDSEIIRAALWARVEDAHYDTRCEALVGLAKRRDLHVTSRVIRELTGESVGKLVVEAAAHLGQTELVNPLIELKDWWDVDSVLLERAIEACRTGKPVG